MSATDATSGPYQHHVKRLTQENKELRRELAAAKSAYRNETRRLRAQRDEGLTPEMSALRSQMHGWRNRALRAEARLQGTPAPLATIEVSTVDELPLWAQKELRHVRREAAKNRVLLKELQRRLGLAEAQLAKARADKRGKEEIARLAMLVELRREELEELRRMMVSSPASAEHRGRKSFRPVPTKRGAEF